MSTTDRSDDAIPTTGAGVLLATRFLRQQLEALESFETVGKWDPHLAEILEVDPWWSAWRVAHIESLRGELRAMLETIAAKPTGANPWLLEAEASIRVLLREGVN